VVLVVEHVVEPAIGGEVEVIKLSTNSTHCAHIREPIGRCAGHIGVVRGRGIVKELEVLAKVHLVSAKCLVKVHVVHVRSEQREVSLSVGRQVLSRRAKGVGVVVPMVQTHGWCGLLHRHAEATQSVGVEEILIEVDLFRGQSILKGRPHWLRWREVGVIRHG